jgi:hypothetical protein
MDGNGSSLAISADRESLYGHASNENCPTPIPSHVADLWREVDEDSRATHLIPPMLQPLQLCKSHE